MLATATPSEAKILWYVGDKAPAEEEQWTEAPKATKSGTYTVWCKTDSGTNWEYKGEPKSVVVTIARADRTAKVTPLKGTYNGAAQKLATSEISKGETNIRWYMGDKAPEPNSNAWSKEVPTRKDAGTYTVWYMVPASPNYVGVGTASVTATIAPATLTVKANAQSKREGDADPALTYQASGFKSTDTLVTTLTGALIRDPGEAPGSDASFYGTTGEARRLEALQLSLANQPVAGAIEYRSHVQKQGWEEEWAKDGSRSGSIGLARRLEAVAIRLTPGSEMEKYYGSRKAGMENRLPKRWRSRHKIPRQLVA